MDITSKLESGSDSESESTEKWELATQQLVEIVKFIKSRATQNGTIRVYISNPKTCDYDFKWKAESIKEIMEKARKRVRQLEDKTEVARKKVKELEDGLTSVSEELAQCIGIEG